MPNGVKADSGMKFDQSRVQKILALIVDLSNRELDQLIWEIQKESARRIGGDKPNSETITTKDK